jgi:protein-S-isoprenylcysteine O-methyltransferase Ste14
MKLRALELKIPPPALAALIALAMWGIARALPSWQVPQPARSWITALIALLALLVSAAAIVAFVRARTTINPTTPGASSALVVSGVFSITRNPMYLGLLCLLIAWALYLPSIWALAGPLVFAGYMGRFQIAPEERALAALFGAEYSAYQARVRRWL